MHSAGIGAVDVNGNVTAIAGGVTNANGIVLTTGSNSYVNGGKITVSGARGETGISDTSGYTAHVYVGNGVYVHDFYGGPARGVVVSTPAADAAYVTLRGDITVRGQSKTNAIALDVSAGHVAGDLYGNISETGDYYSIGARLQGQTYVGVAFGSVNTFAYRVAATGIKASTARRLRDPCRIWRCRGDPGGSAIALSTVGSGQPYPGRRQCHGDRLLYDSRWRLHPGRKRRRQHSDRGWRRRRQWPD